MMNIVSPVSSEFWHQYLRMMILLLRKTLFCFLDMKSPYRSRRTNQKDLYNTITNHNTNTSITKTQRHFHIVIVSTHARRLISTAPKLGALRLATTVAPTNFHNTSSQTTFYRMFQNKKANSFWGKRGIYETHITISAGLINNIHTPAYNNMHAPSTTADMRAVKCISAVNNYSRRPCTAGLDYLPSVRSWLQEFTIRVRPDVNIHLSISISSGNDAAMNASILLVYSQDWPRYIATSAFRLHAVMLPWTQASCWCIIKTRHTTSPPRPSDYTQ